TVPSGPISLNLNNESASTKTSNIPAMTNPSGLRMISSGDVLATGLPERVAASGPAGLVERSVDQFSVCLRVWPPQRRPHKTGRVNPV
ncbi:hypothetical protein, partial [Arthrobacter sp. HMWF013]|uniref:hypothetical protein n=1 Tax=Arthrobacter sp. HMWF013 TaxID=2056849 RepID=UPI001C62BD92